MTSLNLKIEHRIKITHVAPNPRELLNLGRGRRILSDQDNRPSWNTHVVSIFALETMMIEVTQTYDLLPTADVQKYVALVKHATQTILKQPGMREFRAHRNLTGNPQVRTTIVWDSVSDWARFAEGPWQEMQAELMQFATNCKMEMWRPSELVPNPLTPVNSQT